MQVNRGDSHLSCLPFGTFSSILDCIKDNRELCPYANASDVIFLRPDMDQLGTVPVTPTCIPSGMTLYKITGVQNSFRHFISLPQLAPRMPSAGTSAWG